MKFWYKRSKLLSFDNGELICFGDGEYCNQYTLTIQVEYLNGLFTTTTQVPLTVDMFSSPLEQESYWQKLIDSGRYLETIQQ